MKRFRATVTKKGGNSHIVVPERVSRALASFARAGRIRVEGTLNAAPIQGSFVPVRGGRHRFYVNGGMRAAAGVSVGDTVTLAVRAVSRESAPVPPDVAEALASSKSATKAFDALVPSHRRELVRFVDDARTPESRRRRIQKLVAHVLGKTDRTPNEAMRRRPLWICPKCGNEFVNRNQFHSCKRYPLENALVGKPAFVRELFARVRSLVESCGPVKVLPYRDKIGFMVRVRFAGATPRSRGLDVGFWLTRRVEDPRIRRIETIYPNAHVHTLTLTSQREIDADLEAWIREAYAVGCQEHLL